MLNWRREEMNKKYEIKVAPEMEKDMDGTLS